MIGDRHGGRHVRDGRARGEDGEPLDDGVDPQSAQHDLDPPDQAGREQGDPPFSMLYYVTVC